MEWGFDREGVEKPDGFTILEFFPTSLNNNILFKEVENISKKKSFSMQKLFFMQKIMAEK